MSKMTEYEQAFARIIEGKTLRISSDSKLSLDAVALEAGKTRGSLKRSRTNHHDIIKRIDTERNKGDRGDLSLINNKLKDQIALTEEYKKLWREALSREVGLLRKLEKLRTEKINN